MITHETIVRVTEDALETGPLNHWPDMRCGDTCALILSPLRAIYRGTFTWTFGQWDDECVSGHEGMCFHPCGPVGHVWLEWRPTWKRFPDDTLIIDPTYGQFTLPKHGIGRTVSEIVKIITPTMLEWSYYLPDRKGTRDFWKTYGGLI